jgi:hypothetical protein
MNITDKDALKWVVDFFRSKGLELSQVDEEDMLNAWKQYVDHKSNLKETLGEQQVSDGYIGFTTGA